MVHISEYIAISALLMQYLNNDTMAKFARPLAWLFQSEGDQKPT